ncbi:MAG: Galactarate dehydratase, partial [Rhizobium sp.]|nr:Galactarate dehydratase [Rhizobium sp.]
MPALTAPLIILNPIDDVGVARQKISKGEATGYEQLVAKDLIGRGHKIALKAIKSGQEVHKFGQVIGVATADIEAGRHIHLHNLQMIPSEHEYQMGTGNGDEHLLPESERRTFMGFDRGLGGVGTRNYIGIISSVNCSATVSRYIAEHFNRSGGLEGFGNVDGVVALTHGGGCAINSKSEGYRILTRTIQGYARHPNFGGILMIG